MSDEIAKPTEEKVANEVSVSDTIETPEPVIIEAPIVTAEPVSVSEPVETIEPIVVTEPAVIEAPVVIEEPVTIPEPVIISPKTENEVKQIEAKPLSASEPIISESVPVPITSPSSIEPNLEARESVDTVVGVNTIDTEESAGSERKLPNEVLAPTSRLDTIALSFKASMLRAREFLAMANVAIQVKKKKNLEKIMALFVKKDKIRNSDVRDLLHIADPTATVYLNILLKAGKIKREGKNKGVYYTKVE